MFGAASQSRPRTANPSLRASAVDAASFDRYMLNRVSHSKTRQARENEKIQRENDRIQQKLNAIKGTKKSQQYGKLIKENTEKDKSQEKKTTENRQRPVSARPSAPPAFFLQPSASLGGLPGSSNPPAYPFQYPQTQNPEVIQLADDEDYSDFAEEEEAAEDPMTSSESFYPRLQGSEEISGSALFPLALSNRRLQLIPSQPVEEKPSASVRIELYENSLEDEEFDEKENDDEDEEYFIIAPGKSAAA